jgi:hypothetical protein
MPRILTLAWLLGYVKGSVNGIVIFGSPAARPTCLASFHLANSPVMGQIAKATNGVQRMTTANTYDDRNRLTGIPRLSGPQSLSLAGDGRLRLSDVTAPPSGACPLKYDITIN